MYQNTITDIKYCLAPEEEADMALDQSTYHPQVIQECGLYSDRLRMIGQQFRNGRYLEAVADSKELLQILDRDDSLVFFEAVYYFAKALIYTGDTADGIEQARSALTRMEGKADQSSKRWKRLIGKFHNLLGYAYCVERNSYQLAREEFVLAMPYLWDSPEEYANVCDNLGRVYVELGEKDRAEKLIDKALEIRRGLGSHYYDRAALSFISRAIAHLTFGELSQALEFSQQAKAVFEETGSVRGVGLACITLGRVLRQLGSRRCEYVISECAEFLDQAIDNFRQAIAIFDLEIQEPVRLIEACKEMGCAYREYAFTMTIAHKDNRASAYRIRATECLEKACQAAEAKHIPLYLSSCEELIDTHLQFQDYPEVHRWLRKARKVIRPFKACLDQIHSSTPVNYMDGLLYHLAQIELLYSLLLAGRYACVSDRVSWATRAALVAAHYHAASQYSRRYSEAYWKRNFCSQDEKLFVEDNSVSNL
ncbi:MAG: tetratricopeptide repeat protein [Chloroflexota bacterium]